MNFADFIDNNRQTIVNDLNTVKHNLLNIFNLSVGSRSTERFSLTINGMSGIYGRIDQHGKIQIEVTGMDKLRIGFDDQKTLKNVDEKLIPKLSSTVEGFSVRSYSNPTVTISFDRLTQDVVRDIMLLVQSTSAELKPSHIGRF
jgi:hypothetical protein